MPGRLAYCRVEARAEEKHLAKQEADHLASEGRGRAHRKEGVAQQVSSDIFPGQFLMDQKSSARR